MRLEIATVPVEELSIKGFLQQYYIPEKPVLVTGLQPPEEHQVLSLIQHQDASEGFGFVGTSLPSGAADLETPELVSAVLARSDIVTRPRPLRIWAQQKNHRTMFHYDGNSLHGLNWQVSGSKQWILLSPDTPPRMYPFSYFAMTREDFSPGDLDYDVMRFRTGPGDLLFLPRYWAHSVTSLEPLNTNFNWVWTPRQPNVRVATGRRECAVLALRHMIPGLSRLLYQPTSIHNYGAGGEELFQAYSTAVNRWELLACLANELANAALMPFFHRSVMRQADRFARSSKSTLEQL